MNNSGTESGAMEIFHKVEGHQGTFCHQGQNSEF